MKFLFLVMLTGLRRLFAALLLSPSVDDLTTDEEWARVRKAASKVKHRPMPAEVRAMLAAKGDPKKAVEKMGLLNRQLGIDQFLREAVRALGTTIMGLATKLGVAVERLESLACDGTKALDYTYDGTSVGIIRYFDLTTKQYVTLVTGSLGIKSAQASAGMVGYAIRAGNGKKGLSPQTIKKLANLERRLEKKAGRK